MYKALRIISRIIAVLVALVGLILLLAVSDALTEGIFLIVCGVLFYYFAGKLKAPDKGTRVQATTEPTTQPVSAPRIKPREVTAPAPVYQSKKDKIRARIAAAEAAGEAYCPKCGSTSLTANKKGYGIGKGLIGAAVVANPIGLVAGNLGPQKVLVTCHNCGYQFQPGKK